MSRPSAGQRDRVHVRRVGHRNRDDSRMRDEGHRHAQDATGTAHASHRETLRSEQQPDAVGEADWTLEQSPPFGEALLQVDFSDLLVDVREMARDAARRRLDHPRRDVAAQQAHVAVIALVSGRRRDADETRLRPEVPVGRERERRRELDDDTRPLVDPAAAARAQRRAEDRLVKTSHSIGKRRLEVDEVPLSERRERTALRLEGEMPPRVVAHLMHGIDRAELERHRALDDAQDRREVVLERHAEARLLGGGRRRRRLVDDGIRDARRFVAARGD